MEAEWQAERQRRELDMRAGTFDKIFAFLRTEAPKYEGIDWSKASFAQYADVLLGYDNLNVTPLNELESKGNHPVHQYLEALVAKRGINPLIVGKPGVVKPAVR